MKIIYKYVKHQKLIRKMVKEQNQTIQKLPIHCKRRLMVKTTYTSESSLSSQESLKQLQFTQIEAANRSRNMTHSAEFDKPFKIQRGEEVLLRIREFYLDYQAIRKLMHQKLGDGHDEKELLNFEEKYSLLRVSASQLSMNLRKRRSRRNSSGARTTREKTCFLGRNSNRSRRPRSSSGP